MKHSTQAVRRRAVLRLAVVASLGAAGTASAMDACEHRAERNLDLDARGLSALVLNARAGTLDIAGEQGLAQVVVRGTACASDAEGLQAIELSHRSVGGKLTVTAEIPKMDGGWFGNQYRRLDLKIRVPAQLALEIADSSGDAHIRGVGPTSVQDSSGSLQIDSVDGDLTINDSSGDINVRGVTGNLHIPSDSSGNIDVTDVAGNASIGRDSSGDIELRQVRGNARVEVDSSGAISFADIDGSAEVGTDSSGGIDAVRIGRDFTVGNDGSGGITHRDVSGEVRVPTD